MKLKSIILFFITLIIISCNKNFEVSEYNGSLMKIDELLNSSKTNEFIEYSMKTPSSKFYIPNDIYYNKPVEKNNSKLSINRQSIESKAEEDNFVRNFQIEMLEKGFNGSSRDLLWVAQDEYRKKLQVDSEKFNKSKEGIKLKKEIQNELDSLIINFEKEEKIKENRKFNLIKKVKNNIYKSKNIGFINSFDINNFSNQKIEEGYINTLICFDFGYSKYIYLKSYPIITNKKIWNKKETIKFKLYDIINYAKNYDSKFFSNHNPKQVKYAVYITAKNSIGYKNTETPAIINKENFGEILIQNNKDVNYGEKIFEKDITDVILRNLKNQD